MCWLIALWIIIRMRHTHTLLMTLCVVTRVWFLVARFTNHSVNSWNSVRSSDSFRSRFEYAIRQIYDLMNQRRIRCTYLLSTGYFTHVYSVARDSSSLLNFMGAAPCVHTVSLYAREFIDSRVAASSAPASTYHSVLSSLLPPGLPPSSMVSRLQLYFGPLRKIQWCSSRGLRTRGEKILLM